MECFFFGFWITQLETGNNQNKKISGGKEVGEGENKAHFCLDLFGATNTFFFLFVCLCFCLSITRRAKTGSPSRSAAYSQSIVERSSARRAAISRALE